MPSHKKGTPGYYEQEARRRETIIEKYGSMEKFAEFMRENGSKGGTKTYESGKLALVGFGSNRERARTAGALGGKISRRTN